MNRFTVTILMLVGACSHSIQGTKIDVVIEEIDTDTEVEDSDSEKVSCDEAYRLLGVLTEEEKAGRIDKFSIPISHRTVIERPDLGPKFKGGVFIPTQEDIELANEAIIELLNDPQNFQDVIFSEKTSYINEIVKRFNHYYVQYYGIELDGKRSLNANFMFQFPPHNCGVQPEKINDNWKDTLLFAKGGGYGYWHAEFSINDKKITSIWINASK